MENDEISEHETGPGRGLILVVFFFANFQILAIFSQLSLLDRAITFMMAISRNMASLTKFLIILAH